jgi:NADH-quinone oxidoreductase subunit A
MLQELGNALAFLIIAALLPVVILSVTKFFRPSYPHAAKLTTYECGEYPQGSAYAMFNNRFYLVAICFLVFDVEVALLFPVLQLFRDSLTDGTAPQVFLLAFGFLGVLLVGLIYEWKKGDIDWFRDSLDRRDALIQEGSMKQRRSSLGA